MNEKMVEHLKQLCETGAEKYCAWKIGLRWTIVAELLPIVVAFIVGVIVGWR